MNTARDLDIAVLLATYNGARFVGAQIESLKDNRTPFTLHWSDDQSTDDTREIVRAATRAAGIPLREWHQPHHQGPWGAYFRLLECVEANIYLFCDQDDIWQPGKIDATVTDLLPDADSPVLCFSDSLMFNSNEPHVLRRSSQVMDVKVSELSRQSRIFMFTCAFGHTQGFTRPLRELFLRHKEIARAHALGHDWWMYLIAHACGVARLLSTAPTSLYRRHGNNFSAGFFAPRGSRIAWRWRIQQLLRGGVSRQAQGFVRAAATLPPGPHLERLLPLARRVATLDRRQSPAALIQLALCAALWPNWRSALYFAAACLCTNAPDFPLKHLQVHQESMAHS
jgi:glycosyltransferase involved in cell wall biosynthesis